MTGKERAAKYVGSCHAVPCLVAALALGPDLSVIRDDCAGYGCGIVGRVELHAGEYRLVTWRPGLDVGFLLSAPTEPRVSIASASHLYPTHPSATPTCSPGVV